MKPDEVEHLYLSFEDVGGDESMDVTAENREEYVRQKVFYALVESRHLHYPCAPTKQLK